ncbi:MAG: RNA polymerase factor sigma-54 [bacterium]
MKQELRLEQRLLLTPQLLLNLKLLALPAIELQSLIERELETNPVLQSLEEETEEATISKGKFFDRVSTPPQPSRPEEKPLSENTEDYTLADFLQEDTGRLPLDREQPEFDPIETISRASVSLSDILLPQLRAMLDESEIEVAEYIIENLDGEGFLIITEEEILRAFKIDQNKLNKILSIIQHIEPGGIATRNTQKALLVQLEILEYDKDSLEYKILRDYYKPMCKKQFSAIARKCNVTEKNVKDAILNIIQLEPKPARRFTQSNPIYVSPDFTVEWREDKITAVLNDDILPQLRLSRHYREVLLNSKVFPKEEVNFARAKFNSALMLIKGIESRKKTMRRVMNYILKQQYEFFQRGKEFLKPASIQDAGAALGIHPSTISRAIQGKYVETPFGIFPLRFFFVSGTGDVARHSLKDKIKQIIENEDKQTPYSDEEIAEILSKQGTKISRRTVAKYRDEMKISNCSERKEI